MIEFEKPRIECLKLDNDNMYAKFVCEPLERGYGITLGNSLRRILLSLSNFKHSIFGFSNSIILWPPKYFNFYYF